MKKSIAKGYQPFSAEYVVAHAKWKKSRGRQPSMSYKGERNPHKALALALIDLRGRKHERNQERKQTGSTLITEDELLRRVAAEEIDPAKVCVLAPR